MVSMRVSQLTLHPTASLFHDILHQSIKKQCPPQEWFPTIEDRCICAKFELETTIQRLYCQMRFGKQQSKIRGSTMMIYHSGAHRLGASAVPSDSADTCTPINAVVRIVHVQNMAAVSSLA